MCKMESTYDHNTSLNVQQCGNLERDFLLQITVQSICQIYATVDVAIGDVDIWVTSDNFISDCINNEVIEMAALYVRCWTVR